MPSNGQNSQNFSQNSQNYGQNGQNIQSQTTNVRILSTIKSTRSNSTDRINRHNAVKTDGFVLAGDVTFALDKSDDDSSIDLPLPPPPRHPNPNHPHIQNKQQNGQNGGQNGQNNQSTSASNSSASNPTPTPSTMTIITDNMIEMGDVVMTRPRGSQINQNNGNINQIVPNNNNNNNNQSQIHRIRMVCNPNREMN
jgi:hypothetical protein